SLGGGAPFSEAGLLIGAQVKFAAQVVIEKVISKKWVPLHNGIPASKRGGGRLEIQTKLLNSFVQEKTIDFLSIIIKAITFLIKKGQAKALAEVVEVLKPEPTPAAGGKANFGLKSSKKSALKAVGEGTTEIIPKLSLRIDVSEFIPVVQAINKVL